MKINNLSGDYAFFYNRRTDKEKITFYHDKINKSANKPIRKLSKNHKQLKKSNEKAKLCFMSNYHLFLRDQKQKKKTHSKAAKKYFGV